MARKRNGRKKHTGLYLIGCAAAAVGTLAVMPKVITGLSEQVYRLTAETERKNEDDWGPAIVRKETREGKGPDGV